MASPLETSTNSSLLKEEEKERRKQCRWCCGIPTAIIGFLLFIVGVTFMGLAIGGKFDELTCGTHHHDDNLLYAYCPNDPYESYDCSERGVTSCTCTDGGTTCIELPCDNDKCTECTTGPGDDDIGCDDDNAKTQKVLAVGAVVFVIGATATLGAVSMLTCPKVCNCDPDDPQKNCLPI
jgi:hypothetical protein